MTTLDVFILKPPRSTHLAGGNVAEGRTQKAVKQEKSNNVRGAIFSVPKISHPLYHDPAAVRIRLTEMERHTPEEHRKRLFSFFSPPPYVLSNIS